MKLGEILLKNLAEKFEILLEKFGFGLILTECDLQMLAGLRVGWLDSDEALIMVNVVCCSLQEGVV